MEVVVVLRDICQDTEAVRNPKSHHVFCVQQSWNPQLFFCNFKGQLVVLIDIFLLQGIKIDEIGSVFVDEGAESQAVPEGRGHVGDGHIPVALTLDPAPLLQSLHGRHPRPQNPHRPVRERGEDRLWLPRSSSSLPPLLHGELQGTFHRNAGPGKLG